MAKTDERRQAKAKTEQLLGRSQFAIWESISSDITPQLLISYIKAAEQGDLSSQMQLFDRMVDRDARLQAVLTTRRLALTGVDYIVHPADPEDPLAVRAAEEVDAVISGMDVEFGDVIDIMLDGIPKGVQVLEIIWRPDGSIATMNEVNGRYLKYEYGELWVDYSSGTGSNWHALSEEPWKWIVHSPRLKPGVKERRGLMRALGMLWVMKHYAMADWAAFAEVFGMPLRIGRMAPGSGDDQISTLEEALESLGSDASAVIPDGMDIEIIESKIHGTNSSTPMQGVIDYVDKEYAIAALGQNLTTEGVSGSGTLAGGAHENVRQDYLRGDAKGLASTIRRDIFTPIVGYNVGWDAPVPIIEFAIDDSVDEELRSKTYKALSEIGVPLSKSQIREEFNLIEPEDDDDVLAPSEPAQNAPQGFSMLRATNGAPYAVTGAQGSTGLRKSEAMAMKAAEEAEEFMLEFIDLVMKVIENVETAEQAINRIRLAAPDLEPTLNNLGIETDELIDLIGRVMITGDKNGRSQANNEQVIMRSRSKS